MKNKENPNDNQSKKKRNHKKGCTITLCVFASFIAVVILFVAVMAGVNALIVSAHFKMIEGLTPQTDHIAPIYNEADDSWTFVTDNEFKVLQLTDIHIGGGAFSNKKDNWAINAVATLVKNVNPDLVIVTGDIAFPEPFQSGSFNNLREAKLFATLMEQLNVYWAFCFGNHDTEIYSIRNREQISDFYLQDCWEHCLFLKGRDDVDGFGNYTINVEKTNGMIAHSFIFMDSHAYLDDDPLGMLWHYDNIHQNQIEWYKETINNLNQKNSDVFNSMTLLQQADYLLSVGSASLTTVKTSVCFHIPLKEYYTAWNEYSQNNRQDTDDVKFIMGDALEKDEAICCGSGEDELFETILELGSTKNIFVGHDHLNTFILDYKGVILTYGMSIDYLAYPGIWKKTTQRGGTIINVNVDGTINLEQKSLADCE